jgi:Condensation domain
MVDGPDSSASVPAHGGVRSRPLLLLERTMYREGRTPFTSVFTIKLLGTLDENHLRWALRTLQARHPLLRCVVESVDGRPHFVAQGSTAPIPLRIVERTGEDDWQNQVRREWTVPFGLGRQPLARFVWLRGAHASELILVAHHCICDGQSGMTLLEECLRACDDPQETREGELRNLDALQAVEDLVPAVLRQDPHFRRRVGWKMRLLRLGLLLKRKDAGQVGAPIASEQMYFHRWRLDAGTSLLIMDRCRAEGVTVLAAATLAFVLAFRKVRGASALRKAYTMVNVRRFLPQLKPDALFGIAPGVELCLKKLSPGRITEAGFWEWARAIKADMTRRVDRLGAGLYGYLVGLESLHDKYDRLVGDTESAPAVRHLTLSNMGRLDLPTQYRTFTLETVYSPMVMVSPTPANTIVLSSFAGQLEFAIISDTQSLPHTEATAIQQRAMAILRTAAASAESASQVSGARLTGAETR